MIIVNRFNFFNNGRCGNDGFVEIVIKINHIAEKKMMIVHVIQTPF